MASLIVVFDTPKTRPCPGPKPGIYFIFLLCPWPCLIVGSQVIIFFCSVMHLSHKFIPPFFSLTQDLNADVCFRCIKDSLSGKKLTWAAILQEWRRLLHGKSKFGETDFVSFNYITKHECQKLDHTIHLSIFRVHTKKYTALIGILNLYNEGVLVFLY